MVGKYEIEIYEDEDGALYYIDPDSGEEITCDEDGNSLSIPPITKQVQFVGAPEEWKELEKIDKDAEVEDYCENGVWDRDGLRADLKLMREKLGIKVKASPAPKAAAQRKVAKKRKVRKKAKRAAAPPNKSGGTSKMQG